MKYRFIVNMRIQCNRVTSMANIDSNSNSPTCNNCPCYVNIALIYKCLFGFICNQQQFQFIVFKTCAKSGSVVISVWQKTGAYYSTEKRKSDFRRWWSMLIFTSTFINDFYFIQSKTDTFYELGIEQSQILGWIICSSRAMGHVLLCTSLHIHSQNIQPVFQFWF